MDQWKIYWKQRSDGALPASIVDTLKSINSVKEWFPKIVTILKLIAVVPAYSNSCKRSMSKLRVLKNYLRTSMGQERFSALALANIHREIQLNPDEILDMFGRKLSRRLEVVDILSS